MTIVQSPEERERSRTVLLPWLVKLRSWRQGATTRQQKRQAKRFSKKQARMLKAHAKKKAKVERDAEKTKLWLVKRQEKIKPVPIVKNFVRDETRAHPFNPETRVGKHLWK